MRGSEVKPRDAGFGRQYQKGAAPATSWGFVLNKAHLHLEIVSLPLRVVPINIGPGRSGETKHVWDKAQAVDGPSERDEHRRPHHPTVRAVSFSEARICSGLSKK
jgi:hypothetical protein